MHGPVLQALLWPVAAHAQDQRAVLELLVNHVPRGEALVTLRNGDVLVAVRALTDAGLRQFGGSREQIGEDELVSLASLAPAVSFAVDERELKLRLTADPSFLGEHVRTLYSGAPVGLVYRADTTGFLNYAVNYSNDGQERRIRRVRTESSWRVTLQHRRRDASIDHEGLDQCHHRPARAPATLDCW